MTSQQFFLRWDNYSNYISYAFGTLRNQEDLVDVTLSCEGKKIRAHKVLLSACSTYFRDVFKDNPCQHPVIVFKNVKFDDLLAIVEFMYQGEVSVVQDALTSFLHTAELLSVQGLTEGGSTAPSNVVDASTTQLLVPKTVALKPQQQTMTLCPAPERRFVKKVFPGQATATPIKTVTHPITVFSPKATTVRKVATSAAPVKIATTTGMMITTTGGQSHQTATLVTATPLSDTLDPSNAVQAKRKRIVFDSEDNISIEDVTFGKQQQMDIELPDYIEIQTSTVDDKGNVSTINAEELMSGAESDSQAHQESVIIEEESFADDGGQGNEDEDDSKDMDGKDLEITYTDDQGNGTVVLTPVMRSESSKDGENKQSVNYVQDAGADGSNTKWSQCSYCKLVITSVNLWRHVRTQHTAQQPRECNFCQKNFKNKYSLREHIRIAHEYNPKMGAISVGPSKSDASSGAADSPVKAKTEIDE